MKRKREFQKATTSVDKERAKSELASQQYDSSFSHLSSIVGEALGSNARPLDAETLEFMESSFGHDFSEVRIYSDRKASESATELQAKAYTIGNDIVFGDGNFAPHTLSGKRLLAHELSHVIQQAKSNFVPLSELPISRASERAEIEAAAVAQQVQSGHSVTAPQSLTGMVIAREEEDEPSMTPVNPNTSFQGDTDADFSSLSPPLSASSTSSPYFTQVGTSGYAIPNADGKGGVGYGSAQVTLSDSGVPIGAGAEVALVKGKEGDFEYKVLFGDGKVGAGNAASGGPEYGYQGNVGLISLNKAPAESVTPGWTLGGEANVMTFGGAHSGNSSSAQMGGGGTIIGGGISGQYKSETGRRDIYARGAVTAGPSAGIRLHYGDADNDGFNEYGVGVDYEWLSADIKSEYLDPKSIGQDIYTDLKADSTMAVNQGADKLNYSFDEQSDVSYERISSPVNPDEEFE